MFSKINVFFSSTDKTKTNHGNQRAWGQNKPHLRFLKRTPYCDCLQTFIRTLKWAHNVLVPNGSPSLTFISKDQVEGIQVAVCCRKWSLAPVVLTLSSWSQSQHKGLHTGLCNLCCSWCYFLISPESQQTSNFPFTPPQARKRKPAWAIIALTIDGQLPRMWGNDKAPLDRLCSSFLSIRNLRTVLNDKMTITCSG